ncbi:dihydroorotate dehydrogenase electron transfer subunit [Faecalibaculum rodentium]|uniref:dihydroorotate dehydrogenase electron transfer subunit n=1 Tax=Faecalibaculum rodentium TaxID=1702221 RepID=UPI0023F103FF|nr:dihydroorotate dehydrogenase electron transfer subunit [Faecalibaculum rodentium]
MKDEKTKVLSNVPVARGVWKLDLETDMECGPGQFVEVKCGQYFLRRPISVCEAKDGVLTLIYKVVGKGTDWLSRVQPGETVDVFGPLGTGFPTSRAEVPAELSARPVGKQDRGLQSGGKVNEDASCPGERKGPGHGSVLLIGGGVGVPPLVMTARKLQEQGIKVQAVLGFGSRADVFALDLFASLGIEPVIATMDGTIGTKGTVLDAIDAAGLEADLVMSCGPLPMLKAVSDRYETGYVSLESRMACGLGACMGCVVKTPDGSQLRVCKDGPVFRIGEVVL